MRLAILMTLIATTALPTWAAEKLNIPIEVSPCTVITLPDGSKACAPPKVSQVIVPGCIWVTIRENGVERKVLVCTQPRESKPPEAPRTPPTPVGGY